MRALWFFPLALAACFGSRSIGDFAAGDGGSASSSDGGGDGAFGPTGSAGAPAGPGVGGFGPGPGAGGFGPGAGGSAAGGSAAGGNAAGGNAAGGSAAGGSAAGGSAAGGSGGAGASGGMGGTGGGGPILDCVNETCSGGDICCHTPINPNNSACDVAGSCDGFPIEIACQHPSDCPGEICCGIFDNQGGIQGYEEVRCDATCDPPESDLIGIIMCGNDPNVCPGGAANCLDSNVLPPGYNYCDPNP